MSFKAGTFTINTGTGNQSVTGVGFRPTAILFFTTRQTSTGTTTNCLYAAGLAVNSSMRAAVACTINHGSATTVCKRYQENTKCITSILATTLQFEADFVSFDDDGFTINVTTAGAAALIHFLALDQASATYKQIQEPGSAGSQSYTGVGFQPEFLYMFSIMNGNFASARGNAIHGIGVATDATDEYCAGGSSEDGQAAADCDRMQQNQFIAIPFDGVAFSEAELTSMDEDGFTLNWLTVAGGSPARESHVLCLKGLNFKVGVANTKGGTGTKAYTGIGFQPEALMAISFGRGALVGVDSDFNSIHIGLATDTAGTDHAAISARDENAADPTNNSRGNVQNRVLYFVDEDGVVSDDQTLSSFDSDGFTLDTQSTDSVVRQFIYVAMAAKEPTPVAANTDMAYSRQSQPLAY